MKRVIVAIALLLISSNCYAVELLVKAQGHWVDNKTAAELSYKFKDVESIKRRPQKFDIVKVRPDGFNWGNKEKAPHYIVVKVPGLTRADFKHLREELRVDGVKKRNHKFYVMHPLVVSRINNGKNFALITTDPNDFMTNNIKVKTGDPSEVIQISGTIEPKPTAPFVDVPQEEDDDTGGTPPINLTENPE